jgi:hypothetical protein
MGNGLEKLTKKNEPSNFHDYLVLRKMNLEGLGVISELKDPLSNKSYFLLETNYTIINEDMAKYELQQQTQLNDIKHLSPVIKSDVVKDQMLCFDNYSMKILFNDYEKSFDQRIRSNFVLKESDAWIVIGDLYNYLHDLNTLGISNGDIQPKYIQFDENEIVKVVSPLLYTTYQNAYKYRLANDMYYSAYSPELLEEFNNRVQSPKYDPIKSDIFSVGICLLSLCCSENYEYFYNFKHNKINFERIKIKMAQLVKELGFSENIFYFFNLCLKENPNERENLPQLLKIINQKIKKNWNY